MSNPLVASIGEHLTARRWWLASAESCTGGLLGHLLTNQAGSSDWYLGGVVSYSNTLKQNLLHVPAETLAQYGAVSAESVRAMALGICELTGANIGVSITGIAGPGGGSLEKPVGLVWIGLAERGLGKVQAREFRWQGKRAQNKRDSAQAALEWLVEYLR